MAPRIITRPDFDGIACAVLLKEALGHDIPVLWTQPNQIQNGEIHIGNEDIIANLPYYGDCDMWFDHHVSNAIEKRHKGLFRIAPSAAGLVFEYFHHKIDRRFQELVQQADKIDSAQLNLDEILHPERYDYILLSMTLSADPNSDQRYWDHLVKLLQHHTIDHVLADQLVKENCDRVELENKTYLCHLQSHTQVIEKVSLTDFREMTPVPNGNRFLVYSLFPDTVANMKIYHEHDKTVVKIGHSIINRNCHVNVGRLLAEFGGGGHRGAGACRLINETAEQNLSQILEILKQNSPED
jgi:oligoribonuclease NrnB/cAMP/cGMP phosphodiesterase (DHH superfamily)